MEQVRRLGREGDWVGVIQVCARSLADIPNLPLQYRPSLAKLYLDNLSLARARYRRERREAAFDSSDQARVRVIALTSAGHALERVRTLVLAHRHAGQAVELLDCQFPDQGRWDGSLASLSDLGVPEHALVVERHVRFFEQAWHQVFSHPADLVHLSSLRLPSVVLGCLYKLLWGAAVLVDLGDDDLRFVEANQPISLDGLKRLKRGLPPPKRLLGRQWTRLAADLAQRFDGITVASAQLQQRFGGTVIVDGLNPQKHPPATTTTRAVARRRCRLPEQARVVLSLCTPEDRQGLLDVAAAVASLPAPLQPLLIMAGATPDADLLQALLARLPQERLCLLDGAPLVTASDVIASADLAVLPGSAERTASQGPAWAIQAQAMGLPVLVIDSEPERLGEQLQQWLRDPQAGSSQGQREPADCLESIALPAVAEQLAHCAAEVLAAPAPADGQHLTLLESLAPELASPLMARHYQQWSERRIPWTALQRREPDPGLVSVVIPVYGDPAELDQCLQALRAAEGCTRWEAIAVMNDASAESRAVLERHQQADNRIQAVWPGENTQFGLGCNLGFAASSGEWVVFLNNDCRVESGWLEALLAPLQDPDVAAVQPRLLKPDGTVQCLGVVFHDGQTLGYPLYAGLDGELPCTQREHRLQAVTGACLALRAADFAAVQGFDAGYLNSQEDVDLCLRLLQIPDRRVCVSTPATTVWHSASLAPGRFRHTRWSRARFCQRWSGSIQANDRTIYASDHMAVIGWEDDSHVHRRNGIGAGRVLLKPLPAEAWTTNR